MKGIKYGAPAARHVRGSMKPQNNGVSTFKKMHSEYLQRLGCHMAVQDYMRKSSKSLPHEHRKKDNAIQRYEIDWEAAI